MTLTCTPQSKLDGQLCMVLNGNGTDTTAGYRALISRGNDTADFTCTLYHDTSVLATKTVVPPSKDGDTTFRFGHFGKVLWLEQDGARLLEATDAPRPPACTPPTAPRERW